MKLPLICLAFLCIVFSGLTVNGQVWGEYDSRTETRDNAGLNGSNGAKSGFFHTVNPTNYPAGATSWWHLLDVRHSSPGNNFAMQFAGSFWDQLLYFRKTNDNASQPWSKVVLESNGGTRIGTGLSIDNGYTMPATGGLSIGTISSNYSPNTSNWNFDGSTLLFNALDHSVIGFHDSGSRVDFMRIGGGTIQLGYNGGWGEANIGLPGNGIWNNSGNVGIGTTNPDSKLTVAGKIHSREVKVAVNAGADFVFHKDYHLRPLKEVETFISRNQHLPEIASAKEMKANGMELGEMNIKLLQKIEEITLYLIDLKKENEELKLRIKNLENNRKR